MFVTESKFAWIGKGQKKSSILEKIKYNFASI